MSPKEYPGFLARKWVVLRFIPGQGNLKEISCSLVVLFLVPSQEGHLFSYGSTGMVGGVNQICFASLGLILIRLIHPSGYSSDDRSFLKKLSCNYRNPPLTPLPSSIQSMLFPSSRRLITHLLVVRNLTSWYLSYPALYLST